MWTRAEVKQRGKEAFKRNYWKVVLVAMLFTILSGIGSLGNGITFKINDNQVSVSDGIMEKEIIKNENSKENKYYDDYEEDEIEKFLSGLDEEDSNGEVSIDEAIPMFIVIAIAVMIVVLIAIAVSMVIAAIIFNPLEVGIKRFSIVNLNRNAEVKEAAFGFDNCYKNVVNVMFFRMLYTFLWSLLFVIPGIVKAYEYKMIPYLLAENPGMTKEQAFAESKRMMTGNKWKAFVLDLSFIGWMLLAIPTCGIIVPFFVSPYIMMTNAALYEKLRYGGTSPYTGKTADFDYNQQYGYNQQYANNQQYGYNQQYANNQQYGYNQQYANNQQYGYNQQYANNEQYASNEQYANNEQYASNEQQVETQQAGEEHLSQNKDME